MRTLLGTALLVVFVAAFTVGAVFLESRAGDRPVHLEPICDGGYVECDGYWKYMCCPKEVRLPPPCKGPDCTTIVWICRMFGPC